MTADELQVGLVTGEVVQENGRYYSKEIWDQLVEARKQESHYDLLQLTKKIQL